MKCKAEKSLTKHFLILDTLHWRSPETLDYKVIGRMYIALYFNCCIYKVYKDTYCAEKFSLTQKS